LKARNQRTASASQVIDRLRPKLAVVPGATLVLQAVQDVRIGGRSSAALYQYTIQSDNLDELNQWGPKLLATMRRIPQLTDVTSDAQNNGLAANLVIDRRTASRLGITPQTIDNVLYDGFGEREIATTYTPINQYFVVMEVEPQFWQHPDALSDVYVSGSGGAVNLINSAEAKMGMPASMTGSFSGTAQAFKASLANEPLLIAAAIATVYIVLGVLYESYIHPITILSTLPSAGVGALLALLITNTSLSVIALVGVFLLIGIVKKNAIMMIDFALEVERREHLTPK